MDRTELSCESISGEGSETEFGLCDPVAKDQACEAEEETKRRVRRIQLEQQHSSLGGVR